MVSSVLCVCLWVCVLAWWSLVLYMNQFLYFLRLLWDFGRWYEEITTKMIGTNYLWLPEVINGNIYFSFLSCYFSEGRERGYLPWFGVLLLWPVPEPHSEQQRWDHAVLQDVATQWPPPAHREIRRLCQPGSERWGRFSRHQSGFWGLWGHRGASQWKIQWQCLARHQSDTQPETGNRG